MMGVVTVIATRHAAVQQRRPICEPLHCQEEGLCEMPGADRCGWMPMGHVWRSVLADALLRLATSLRYSSVCVLEMSRDGATMDGVWIGNRVYCTSLLHWQVAQTSFPSLLQSDISRCLVAASNAWVPELSSDQILRAVL
jgi:hypothetical protein